MATVAWRAGSYEVISMLLSRKMGEMQGSQPDIAGQPSLQSGGDERNAWAHRFVSPSTPFASVGVGGDSKHVPLCGS